MARPLRGPGPHTTLLQPPPPLGSVMDGRPESYFDSQQDATDIYDLYDSYGRESVYSVGRESVYDDGGGLATAPGPSPLRFPNKELAPLDGSTESDGVVAMDSVPGQGLASPDVLRRPSDTPAWHAVDHPPPVMAGWSRRPSAHSDVGGGGGGGGSGGSSSGSSNSTAAGAMGMSGVPQWAPEPQHIHPSSNPSSPAGLGAPLSVVTTGVPSLVMSANTAPSIATTVTPTTPTASIPAASALPPHVRTSERNLAAAVEDPSAATLSPTGSSASSPVHASIRRIHSTQRVASQMTGSSGISSVSSVALSPGGISQASLVSTQYPGEEADAFHVRSTYARLEVEGVHGDGWDEGVERTRGGAANAPERKTIAFPAPGAITDQERNFIKSLDRYGFVNQPTRSRSEGRLAFVPAAPLKKVPKLGLSPSPRPKSKAASGPVKPPPSPTQPPEHPPSGAATKARRKEEERVSKWMKMMSVAERDKGGNITAWKWSAHGDGAKHPTRVYKGVPDRWRMAAWWTMAESRSSKAGRQPSHQALEAEYLARKEAPSTSDVQIDLDVPRTISGHALFRTRFGHGQRALFHVLHVFSLSCGTCAYCQGMGSVAATLLCYYEPEHAYTLLVRMHDLYDLHGIFAPGFPGLLETLYVQERLMEFVMPDLYDTFKQNMISSTAWGTKIYITLFVNTMPFNVQLRIWDAFFLDGYDVMIVTVLALLWAFKPLLAAPGADFESILSLLSSYFVPEDDDALMSWVRKFLWQPGVKERMAAWRQEWRGLVQRGQTDGKLL